MTRGVTIPAATTPETLAAAVAALGVRRMLVISDGEYDHIHLALRLVAPEVQIVNVATRRGPTLESDIRSALETFGAHGCDSVLAIGGDGVIDTAKVVKAFAARPSAPLTDPPATASTPLIAAPVGAGLGSETTTVALVQTATGVISVSGDALAVDRAALLPSASKELSPAERKAFGVTVLCRAINAALIPDAPDTAIAEAGHALALVTRSLFDFLNRDDPRSHNNMALAAHRTGAATTGVGIISAMGLALAEQTELELDAALAIAVVPVLRELAEGRAVPGARSADWRTMGAALEAKDAASTVERIARLLAFLQVPVAAATVTASPATLAASAASRMAGSFDPAELEGLFAAALRPDDTAEPADPTLALEFEALRRFTAFAWRYQLTYFLFGDTLRDAIVHGRLTPWNPGITVAVPRGAYVKLAALRDRLPRGLMLDDFTSNPDRASVLPRIVDLSGGDAPGDAAGFAALPGITIHVLEGRSRSLIKRVPQYALQRLLYRAYGAARTDDITPAKARTLADAAARASVATRASRRPFAYIDLTASGGLSNARLPAVIFGRGRLARLGDAEFVVPDRARSVLKRLFGAAYTSVAAVRVDTPMRTVPTSADVTIAVGNADPIREAPFISVIVPVYNVQRYLAACLDSLCNQGYDRYEIIAVDDGSTDGSSAILAEYARDHPDLVRVLRKENGGLADARNHGIAHAKGEYLLFVDSDDLISRQSLRILADRVRSTDADMIAFGFYDYWSDSGEATPRFLGSPESYGHSVRESPELLLSVRPYAWNKLYRASLFSDFGISYPKGQAFEDSATTYNLMLEANRIELVPDALYYYRRDNPDSITNTVNDNFYDILKSFQSIRDYYWKHDAFELLRPELLELMRRVAASRFHRLESARDPEFVARFVDAVYDDLDANEAGWNHNDYFKVLLSSPAYATDPRHAAMADRESMKRHLVALNQREESAEADAPEYSTAELGRMLQQEGLRILVEIDDFCRSHDITYYLAEGTLLGAVRHQGFVPWDDDIDIGMPRADYERFVSLLHSGAAPQLTLFNSRTFPRYHLTFTKVLAAEPSEFTTMFVDVPEKFRGPAVDVFPLDAGVKERFPRRERRVRWLRDVLLFKAGHLTVEKRPHQRGRARVARVLGYRFLQNAIQRYYRIHETSTKPTYVVNFASSYTVDKEKFRAEWLGRPLRVPFENHLFPIPADADAVLTTVYGDYMKLPPKEKRRFRHRPTWRGETMHISE